MLTLIVLFVTLAATPSTNVPRTRDTTPLTVRAPGQMEALLEQGRISQVDAVLRNIKDVQVRDILSRLSLAQLHFDMKQLAQVAKQCERQLVSRGNERYFLIAYYCNEVARSAALNIGDAKAFLLSALSAKQVLLPKLSQTHDAHLVFGNGLDNTDLARLSQSVPAPSEKWRQPERALRIANVQDVTGLRQPPKVTVRINGVDAIANVRLSIGLRAPVTIVTRPDDADTAYAKYHLKRLVHPLSFITAKGEQQTTAPESSLALAKTVYFGPLRLRNLAIEVIPSEHAPAGVYIGMSLLRRFGSVAISTSTISLSRNATAHCSGGVAMTYASSMHEDGNLVFASKLNNMETTSTWNPGLGVPASIGRTTFRTALGAHASGFTPKGDVLHPSVTIQVGDQVLHPTSVETPRTWHEPFDMKIGEASLTDHTVYLDFVGKQPSIAFCKTLGHSRGSGNAAR